jgi:O-methyltransferase domain/Dimerisation domain
MSSPSQPSLPPALRVSQMVVGLWVPQAIHAAAELGLADVLREKPLGSRVVAERLGTHPDATDRLMRALAVLGLLARQGDDFELTETGHCLEARSPTSRRAWARLMGGAEVWKSWGGLTECVRSGRKSFGRGGRGSSDLDTFDALAADPESVAVFHESMVEMTRGVAPGIVNTTNFGEARFVVDVGGGYGALLCAALVAHPGLQGAVFDLDHARAGALALFGERGVAPRARYVVGSFFEEAPPRADVYLLKSVIHDWDDERSTRILGNCRAVMDATARLLLVEPPAGPPSGNPVGDWFLAFSDLNMLVNTGGRERTEAEYVALLESAALRVLAVRETGGFYRVFEAVRA